MPSYCEKVNPTVLLVYSANLNFVQAHKANEAEKTSNQQQQQEQQQ
jgi:hypothetical protein